MQFNQGPNLNPNRPCFCYSRSNQHYYKQTSLGKSCNQYFLWVQGLELLRVQGLEYLELVQDIHTSLFSLPTCNVNLSYNQLLRE